MLVLGSSLLLTTVLNAQESNKSVVEKLTADYDSKIQARVDLFNKIQQQKPVYDTVGLYAFRHDWDAKNNSPFHYKTIYFQAFLKVRSRFNYMR